MPVAMSSSGSILADRPRRGLAAASPVPRYGPSGTSGLGSGLARAYHLKGLGSPSERGCTGAWRRLGSSPSFPSFGLLAPSIPHTTWADWSLPPALQRGSGLTGATADGGSPDSRGSGGKVPLEDHPWVGNRLLRLEA